VVTAPLPFGCLHNARLQIKSVTQDFSRQQHGLPGVEPDFQFLIGGRESEPDAAFDLALLNREIACRR
jgi:hypothetical protein